LSKLSVGILFSGDYFLLIGERTGYKYFGITIFPSLTVDPILYRLNHAAVFLFGVLRPSLISANATTLDAAMS
jgi:hypothetical protein